MIWAQCLICRVTKDVDLEGFSLVRFGRNRELELHRVFSKPRALDLDRVLCHTNAIIKGIARLAALPPSNFARINLLLDSAT